MDADDLFDNLDEYLRELDNQNPKWRGYRIEWIRDNPNVGSRHMLEKHGVTENEVEEVLFELPPDVEAKVYRENRTRIAFRGATRAWRWLVVICESGHEGSSPFLRPLTAFEPDEGRDYWERL